MSVSFSLIKKGSVPPADLLVVDADMCAHFGVPCDEKKWYKNWYNIIGFLLACGLTPSDIKGIVGSELAPIVEWLEANYDVVSWRSS